MTEIEQILMNRDGLTPSKAKERLNKVRIDFQRYVIDEGMDPEEFILDELGLESDYIMDLFN